MTDQGLLQRISELNSDPDRTRLIESIDPPWPDFSPNAFRDRLDRMVISHKPDHGTPGQNGKTTGALHNDTAYGLIEPGKNGTWKVVSRAALQGFLTPKDMDAALPTVRDNSLRAALTAEWERFKQAKPADNRRAATARSAKRIPQRCSPNTSPPKA